MDFPTTLSKLAFDQKFCDFFGGIPIMERHIKLENLGEYVYQNDVGGYRSELLKSLRYIEQTGQLDNVDKLINDHCKWLFTTLNDVIAFKNPESAYDLLNQYEINYKNFELLVQQKDKNGIILMGVYKNHIGFLIPKLIEHNEIYIIRKPNTELSKSPLIGCFYNKVNLIDADQNGGKKLFYALKNKKIVGLYSDFLYPESRAQKGFLFGKPVNFSETLVRLIKATKSTIIPFSITKHSKNNKIVITIEFHDIIKDIQSETSSIENLFIKMNISTELLVRNKPEQWRLWNTLQLRWYE
ncbi:hypothetical protein [Mucilaginibacter sp. 3215]